MICIFDQHCPWYVCCIPIHKTLHQVLSNLWDVIIVAPSMKSHGMCVIREQKNPHTSIKVLRQPLLRPTHICVSLQPCASPHSLCFMTILQAMEKYHIEIKDHLIATRWLNLSYGADLPESSQTPILKIKTANMTLWYTKCVLLYLLEMFAFGQKPILIFKGETGLSRYWCNCK